MANNDIIFKWGRVISIYDETDGRRIKATTSEDRGKKIENIPYAFPLLPKVINCMPKIGEFVLICTSQLSTLGAQRYYIGPIISQFQSIDMAGGLLGFGGSATSLLQGDSTKPMERLSDFTETEGAFPDKNDVALIGRKDSDIILKDHEVDIRCGIRRFADGTYNKNLKGYVVFNNHDPAYIQMKYLHTNKIDGKSLVNIVADKINFISHKDIDNYHDAKLTHANSKNGESTDPLMTDDDITNLIGQLHSVPYGDVLARILKRMLELFMMHGHNMIQVPPTVSPIFSSIKESIDHDIDTNLQSKHIRIS